MRLLLEVVWKKDNGFSEKKYSTRTRHFNMYLSSTNGIPSSIALESLFSKAKYILCAKRAHLLGITMYPVFSSFMGSGSMNLSSWCLERLY